MLRLKKTSSHELVTQGVVAAMTEVAYIILVGIFFLVAEAIFPATAGLVLFGIVAFFILLVASVAITGVLIFGKPLHYFLEKKYEEAMTVFAATIVSFFTAFFLILFVSILIASV